MYICILFWTCYSEICLISLLSAIQQLICVLFPEFFQRSVEYIWFHYGHWKYNWRPHNGVWREYSYFSLYISLHELLIMHRHKEHSSSNSIKIVKHLTLLKLLIWMLLMRLHLNVYFKDLAFLTTHFLRWRFSLIWHYEHGNILIADRPCWKLCWHILSAGNKSEIFDC